MKGTYLLFDVPFDRSQSALPVPVFNNDGGGGHVPCSRTLPGEAGFVCSSFFVFLDFLRLLMGRL